MPPAGPDSAAPPPTIVALPYSVALRRHRCCQTAGGTHADELRHALDFSLPVGTPVLAAADGVVAAAVDGFRGCAMQDAMRARANYVALRHADGRYSRYYHLASVGVRCGERVRAGARLGLSGNTGYTAGPHLHFDVADRLPTAAAALALARDARSGDRATTPVDALRCAAGVAVAGGADAPLRLGCLPAAFSGPLPAAPAVLDAVWADPPNAAEEALRNAAAARGRILFVDRCADVDFYDKGLRAEAAGAAAVVVVNSTEDGPALHAMAYPKRLRGTPGARPLRIPALMVARDAGEAARAAIAAAGEGEPAVFELGATEHGRPDESGGVGASPFVARTVPLAFVWEGHAEGWAPRDGERPPKGVGPAVPAGGEVARAARRGWLPKVTLRRARSG